MATTKKAIKKAPAKKAVKKLPPKKKGVLVAIPVKLIVDPDSWRIVGVKQIV